MSVLLYEVLVDQLLVLVPAPCTSSSCCCTYLRKAWDFGPVIHAIWRIWVKVMPVAWVWRFHGFMNGSFWIFIFVIDAKEEGIRGWHRTRLDWYCPQDTSTRGSHAGWFLVVWRASSSCSVQ